MTASRRPNPDAAAPGPSLLNFRDTAHAARACHGPVHGRLFRGSTPDALGDTALQQLTHQHGLVSILDLRQTSEQTYQRQASRCGLVYRRTPLLDVGALSPVSLEADYVARLDYDRGLPRAVEMLAAALDHPTLVHCTAGKDRTGILIAVTLDLAGWPASAILDDYLATTADLPALRRRHDTRREIGAHPGDLAEAMFECRPAPLLTLLNGLRERGGAENWALRSGIPHTSVVKIQSQLMHRQGAQSPCITQH